MAMHMEAEVPGIGAVGCYAEKQSPLCGKRKRQQKPLEEEDRQPRSVTPGALRVLPQANSGSETVTADEEKERAFTRNFISFLLSKVSKETDAQYMDSVNSCDPSKVAAQLESVLFENWGFNDQSLESTEKYSTLFYLLHAPAIKDFRRQVLLGEISPTQLVHMSLDELHSKYPNHMDDLCENCYEVWFEKLRNSLIECGMMKRVTVEPLGTKQRQQLDPSPRLDPPGTAVWGVLRQVLPQDIEKERAYERNFISFLLSKVSKETDARYMDSVNACDPSKVAAQLESVLFENWGFKGQSPESNEKYSTVFCCVQNPANKDLRRQVLLGEISSKQLVNMSRDEVYDYLF
ncbi:hypothetical protein TB2_007459 [Malus domestica]